MGRKNKILVPEAKGELDQLKASISNSTSPKEAKYETAQEQDITLIKGYNGEMKAKEAGKIGGNIGGRMVQELVKRAQRQLTNKN